ncbi:hypothetical protein VP01_1073g2 [Puccinia sorghi]|uniref:Uncharacterized protein n=1 Tax=Puccinia sorghi TaxID=27349 RepID=A0A0L6VTK5_9BASI|nr:hypothetical protein VP01_1073g2 [Puccinia sorghi]
MYRISLSCYWFVLLFLSSFFVLYLPTNCSSLFSSGGGGAFQSTGTHRYFRVQKILQTGHFPHSRRSIGLTTLIVSALLVVTAVGMFRVNF